MLDITLSNNYKVQKDAGNKANGNWLRMFTLIGYTQKKGYGAKCTQYQTANSILEKPWPPMGTEGNYFVEKAKVVTVEPGGEGGGNPVVEEPVANRDAFGELGYP